MLTQKGNVLAREKFYKLWSKHDKIENHFKDMLLLLGVQASDLCPKYVGFNKCLFDILLSWFKPIVMCIILVKIKCSFWKVIAILATEHACEFCFQVVLKA